MKKRILPMMIVAVCATCTSCLAPVQNTGAATSSQPAADPLNGILGGIMESVGDQNGIGGVLGNILASVVGSATTTQANLIGTWTYYEPSVQFESENLLKQAGGAAAATKVEAKLENVYKMVGITPGSLVFNFSKDGQLSYTIGTQTFTGTYVFDNKNKTVTLTTTSGLNLTSYVTISGTNLSLCFDSSKLLALVSGASANGASGLLGAIGTVAQTYSGMKTGFKFKR